jgi:DNA-binding NtrC family response regulator
MDPKDEYSNLAVVVVDDEPHFLKACARMLRSKSYSAVTFDNPAEAFEGIQGRRPEMFGGKDIAVLVTDNDMPVMKGKELIEMVKGYCPETTCVLMSAGMDHSGNTGKADYFMAKPIDPDEFKCLVDRAVMEYCERRGQSSDPVREADSLLSNPIEAGHMADKINGTGASKSDISVVVVDDNWCIVSECRMVFESEGCHVRTVKNPEEACRPYDVIRRISDFPLDILLTDYSMNGMNGQQVIDVVREKYPQVMAIMMSGQPKPKGCTADAFLEKPLSYEDFEAQLDAFRRRDSKKRH